MSWTLCIILCIYGFYFVLSKFFVRNQYMTYSTSYYNDEILKWADFENQNCLFHILKSACIIILYQTIGITTIAYDKVLFDLCGNSGIFIVFLCKMIGNQTMFYIVNCIIFNPPTKQKLIMENKVLRSLSNLITSNTIYAVISYMCLLPLGFKNFLLSLIDLDGEEFLLISAISNILLIPLTYEIGTKRSYSSIVFGENINEILPIHSVLATTSIVCSIVLFWGFMVTYHSINGQKFRGRKIADDDSNVFVQ